MGGKGEERVEGEGVRGRKERREERGEREEREEREEGEEGEEREGYHAVGLHSDNTFIDKYRILESRT